MPAATSTRFYWRQTREPSKRPPVYGGGAMITIASSSERSAPGPRRASIADAKTKSNTANAVEAAVTKMVPIVVSYTVRPHHSMKEIREGTGCPSVKIIRR
jgi:hypothetical protein